MGVLMFLFGFMVCGFIFYGIFTYVVWKTLRNEDICGIKIDFTWPKESKGSYAKNRSYDYRLPYGSYYVPKYHEFDKSKILDPKNPVYIDSEADGILDIFEAFLSEFGIKIPCEDNGEEIERAENGNTAIYGMAYCDLQNDVEEYLRKIVENISERGWV